jgi:malonate-semialdehyde dehydrogenase (acetylating) / methylmalonate-semialdehyde dehydrogenase
VVRHIISRWESLVVWDSVRESFIDYISYQGGKVSNYISGEFSESKTDRWTQVLDPSTQTPLSKVPETTEEEFNRAVEAASDAFKTWSRTSILTRQKFALEYAI